MDQVYGIQGASDFASEDDVISSMPENVITNILDRLPIQDAVTTGILSRNWRFKWNMVTQLVFDDKFFEFLLRRRLFTPDYWYGQKNISSLLLHVKGPIRKFVLYIPDYMVLDFNDLNHWIVFLSRKGIQELTIVNMNGTQLKLPSHLFSCLQLKHLKLQNCFFPTYPSFCGFPNLLSLDLYLVTFESGSCGEIITRCPLLEILIISFHDPLGKLKLVEIAKLENLKMLSLPLRKLDHTAMTTSSIFQLGGYLPKLQELYLDFQSSTFLGETGARKWVCNAFPNLKTLTLFPVNFHSCNMVSWAFEMIWGSPNLQTLKITATYTNAILPPVISSSEVDYNTLGQLQLQSVVFSSCKGSQNEVYLIKSLLACSPLLKNITINAKSSVAFGGENGKLTFATKLLKLHRASPVAEVNLYWT